jgi:hypothetical protein
VQRVDEGDVQDGAGVEDCVDGGIVICSLGVSIRGRGVERNDEGRRWRVGRIDVKSWE